MAAKKKKHGKPTPGLTAEEERFNRKLRQTVRRLRRAVQPILAYDIGDRFRDEFRSLAVRLQLHLIAPRGQPHVGDHQGPVAAGPS